MAPSFAPHSDHAGAVERVARVLQITDCHLGPDPGYRLAGVRTLFSFDEVLARIARDEDDADLVMVTGDIAAHGSAQAYRTFTERMRDAGLSYAWLPGNHDDFPLMQERLDASPYWPLLELGNWRLISLNTAVPDFVGGNLGEDELLFLRQSLASETDSHIALFMHHPPMSVGCWWLDRQQVANGHRLSKLVTEHRNVKAIFTGHVHQESSLNFAGVAMFTTPSTCFQFAAGRDDFGLASLPPAYRWIDLYADGSLETGIVWIDETREKVDTSVHGY